MPVEITSWAELDAVRNDLTEDYILMADLDADSEGYETYAGRSANDGAGWLPLGDYFDGYEGTFDGNDHTISDLYIYSSESEVGLFGGLLTGGVVQDLTLADVTIISYTTHSYPGGITCTNYGTISNCHVSGSISGNKTVGGIACNGEGSSVISGCSVSGTIRGGTYIGGIIGWQYIGDSLSQSYCTADVSYQAEASNQRVGGVCGYNFCSTITDCYATGDVSGLDEVGGVCGRFSGEGGVLDRCYATGDVTAESCAGGLIGYCSMPINDCYATGDVEGGTYSGGLVGYLLSSFGATLEHCYSTGAASGDGDVGGLIGGQATDACGWNSFWDTETSGNADSAGGTGKTTAEMKDIDTYADLTTEGLGTQLTGTATVGSPMTDVALSDDLSGDLSTDDWICLRGGSPEVAEARKVATVTASPPSLTVTEAFTEAFSTADIYKVTDAAWPMVLLPDHDGTASPDIWFINEEESEYPRLWFEYPDLSNNLTLAPVTCYGTGLVTWAWWQDAVPVDAKRIFICILTGAADGLDDLTLPMSSLQYRLYDDGRGYLSIIVPDVDAYSGDIADRVNGTLIIYQGIQYSDGTQSFTEMVRSTLGDVRYDKGGRNSSLTLTGGGSLTFPSHPELDKEITAVTGEFLQTDGTKKIRCLPVFGLYTGDVFLYGGTYYLATYISCMIGGTIAQMEITYTDESVGTLYELSVNTNTGVEW